MNMSTLDHVKLELVTLYEISKILNSSLDTDKTFREAFNVLSSHMGYRRSMIVLQEDDGALHLSSATGLSQRERDAGHYAVGEGVIGKVFSSGIPMVIPDIAKEPLFLNRTGALDTPTTAPIAFMAVPIRAGQRTLGVLSIDRPAPPNGGGFRDDIRLLTMIGHLVGQTLVLRASFNAERERLLNETKRLEQELTRRFHLDNVVGSSAKMQEVFAEVHLAAPSRSTVLLRGESGTGKEVIARAIHEKSKRSSGPFIKVNCAALTESILESELFGHEKGAFTGAISDHKGRFEMADGGTLFLDEIGDISPAFQAKLLRVLQEREFERVGGNRSIKVDVRLVCATNRNLEKMVQSGAFRADLYYRINVVSIFLPPLRERRDDIPPLVSHFVDRYNKENKRKMHITAEAVKVLANCYWPGNVRELENCIERTATMTEGNVISVLNFPCHTNRCLTQALHHLDKEDAVAPARAIKDIPVVEVAVNPPQRQFGEDRPDGERERLIWALEQCGWVQAKAARLLNITPRQMGYALQKHGVEIQKF